MTTDDAAHTREIESATRDLLDALSRLEALGQAPFPVGDPSPTTRTPLTIAGWAQMGIHLKTEDIIWSPPDDTEAETTPGMWMRWPHAWLAA
ncbi:hypothetical protein [Streptomyces sp. NPDC056672]|uniref:hypothetical protein n=1 Tax=Streptomyces sp. NPDC056672 TaxID=3345906 RepID=UPI00367F322F